MHIYNAMWYHESRMQRYWCVVFEYNKYNDGRQALTFPVFNTLVVTASFGDSFSIYMYAVISYI